MMGEAHTQGNLYLVGFMASGKSTVGRKLAQVLNRRFVDMDSRLEERFGMPISEVFERDGEKTFRDAEHAMLRALSRRRRLVVATGGGLPERDESRDLMRKSGKVIYLEAGLETCMQRIDAEGSSKRPLWTDSESLGLRLKRRRPAYEDCHFRVGVDGKDTDEIVDSIVGAFFPAGSVASVSESPIISTWHAADDLKKLIEGRRAVVLTDRRVARLHLERFEEALGDPLVIEIPTGETSKSLRTAQRVYTRLIHEKIERGDLLVAIGGGVITDLGAFIAGTYKRGMGLVLVSTTVLGCVDAAIGGKAGVNVGVYKNFAGLFILPEAVLLDIRAMETLPRRRLVEGTIEAYKTGLVSSEELATYVESELMGILGRDLPTIHHLVALSSRAKAQVVAQDLQEKGIRRILNLGHTYGHALEGWREFRVSHGEAVAVGMMVAVRLSRLRGLLSDELESRIVSNLKRMIRRTPLYPSAEEAWTIMQNDKKVQGGCVVFVLLRDVGEPVIVDDVSMVELAEAIAVLGEG